MNSTVHTGHASTYIINKSRWTGGGGGGGGGKGRPHCGMVVNQAVKATGNRSEDEAGRSASFSCRLHSNSWNTRYSITL